MKGMYPLYCPSSIAQITFLKDMLTKLWTIASIKSCIWLPYFKSKAVLAWGKDRKAFGLDSKFGDLLVKVFNGDDKIFARLKNDKIYVPI